jgi:hypothetical protein
MDNDTNSQSYDESLPVVIVLGDFAHEGLTAKIESLGFTVINKRFRSTPRNWEKIIEILRKLNKEGRLAVVFGYIPTPTLLLMAEEQYDEVRRDLLSELELTKTLFFVYEDNLQGIVEPIPWEVEAVADEKLGAELKVKMEDKELEDQDTPWRTIYDTAKDLVEIPAREEWINEHKHIIGRSLEMLADWTKLNIEVLPFRKRSDVTIRMFEALDDAQAGIFLRLYVPHGRYQSEQLEDFLTLFTRYLRDVEGKEFSVDVQRTNRGTTYIFKGRGDASSVEDLRKATERFDSFLVLVQNDSAAAERVLLKGGTAPEEAGFIVAKYARSFRRLHLEIRHEYERKRLVLIQQMEAELLDANESAILPIPADDRPSTLFAVVGNTAPVTINLAPAAISTNSKVAVENVLSDGIKYTNEDKVILDLLTKVKDEVVALQLRSDLDRLKDPATSPEARRTAVQKLKGFLYSMGKKVEHISTEVLIAYLNSLITGK